jgi:hypothetical protein
MSGEVACDFSYPQDAKTARIRARTSLIGMKRFAAQGMAHPAHPRPQPPRRHAQAMHFMPTTAATKRNHE